MSLVPTFVQSQDGLWYKNPVIRMADWFICWDDNEPIELVVKVDSGALVSDILYILDKKWGWDLTIQSKFRLWDGRIFDGEVHRAISVPLKQVERGPPDLLITEHDGGVGLARPTDEGVYYYDGPNGHAPEKK